MRRSDENAWAYEEFGHSVLGDARRTRRLVELAATAAANPGGTMASVFDEGADREGAFRFVENTATLMAERDLTFVRDAFEPVIAASPHVRAVFSGHAHIYDRMYVPFDGHATRADSAPPASYALGEGIQYITTGGGGGPLGCSVTLKKQTSYDFLQMRHCVHHVTHVTVEGSALTIEAVAVDGPKTSYTTEVVDSFRVE